MLATSQTMQLGELVACLTQVALFLQEALDADEQPDICDFSTPCNWVNWLPAENMLHCYCRKLWMPMSTLT